MEIGTVQINLEARDLVVRIEVEGDVAGFQERVGMVPFVGVVVPILECARERQPNTLTLCFR